METKMSGSVRDIVSYTAGTDARETVVDAKTGAKIRIDLSGAYDEEMGVWGEPFTIEHGDNVYDAFDRKEAIMILSGIRRGLPYPDMPESSGNKPKKVSKKKKLSTRRSSSTPTSIRGLR